MTPSAQGSKLMFTYGPFEMKEDAERIKFIEQRTFANVIVSSETGPQAAHVPMIVQRDDAGNVYLEGHVSRSNPMAKLAAGGVPSLAIFNGVDAYVTPSYYPSKQVHGKVAPTWNYIAVHATGVLDTFDDAGELRGHLEALTGKLEGGREVPWTVADAPEDFTEKMVAAIMGLRLRVTALEGVRKLNQNQRDIDLAGARDGLLASGDVMSKLVAEEMAKESGR